MIRPSTEISLVRPVVRSGGTQRINYQSTSDAQMRNLRGTPGARVSGLPRGQFRREPNTNSCNSIGTYRQIITPNAKASKRNVLGVVDQTVVDGIQRQLQAIRDPQLIEDIVQVVFHGLLGDEQFFADLLVSEALRHELHDLFFTIA
jgi:hypothetical protein